MKECKEEEELFGEDRTVYLESCQDGWFTFFSSLSDNDYPDSGWEGEEVLPRV